MYIGIYMKYIELKTHDPYLNLAIEEYIFENAKEETFILWQNNPCIVIGKNQNPYAEINIPLAKQRKIDVVRRITGGGAVYHDLGNLNYSFVSPTHKNGIDFAYFTAPIIKALKSIGVECTLSGRNDLVLSDGRKISGNAQFSRGGRVLHHGTLLYNSNLDVLDELLSVDPEKLQSKAVRSARARVSNIAEQLSSPMHISDFILSIKRSVTEDYLSSEETAPSNADIFALRARNASSEWIYNDKDYLSVYSVIRKRRFDFGSVECHVLLKGNLISEIKIIGDFFEKSSVNQLEAALRGMNVEELDLSSINVSNYILGMSNSEFISLIYDNN